MKNPYTTDFAGHWKGMVISVEKLAEILKKADSMVWGPWMLALILGTGIYLMVRLRLIPVRKLWYALKCLLVSVKNPYIEMSDLSYTNDMIEVGKDKSGEISALSSLTTELAATIGTGNIVGVATAMVLGGPGALVWMLLSAVVGFSTKYAESMLSVKYRIKSKNGEYVGGPMYTLERAFPNKRIGKLLATMFACFAVFASFGMGNMTQSNSIALAIKDAFDIPVEKTGLAVSILVILVILGGIKSISKITLYMVPGMALFYIMGVIVVIFANIDKLPQGIEQIFTMAFSREAVAGGAGGAIVASMQGAMRYGISRGVFSNEAGLGAAGITAAAANTTSHVRQGYISMTGVFFDTIVICTLTGLAISASGLLGIQNEAGELITGTELMIGVFATVFGEFGAVIISIGIALFAFATIIAWEYQGERAFEFLVKKHEICICYRFVYALLVFAGAVCALEIVWDFSDIMNGLMAVPNLICILALSKEICSDTMEYQKTIKG